MKTTGTWYSILFLVCAQFCATVCDQKVLLVDPLQQYASSNLAAVDQKIELIRTIKVNKNTLTVQVNEDFKKTYLLDNFFAVYDSDIDLRRMDESILIMPFILNIISIIWISGKDYYIESMDKDLYTSLQIIKRVFQRMYPKTSWEGNLIPRRLINNKPQSALPDPTLECGLLFSGGLDSTSSALSHRNKKLLLITVRGQWDVPLDDDQLWQTRHNEFKEFAATYGHKNAFVVSNFSSFLNWDVLETMSPEITGWRLDTCEGMGMFGLAAPIMYAKGCPHLLMASSFSWTFPWPTAANPLVDNNLVFAQSFRMEHDQFDMMRYEKLQFIISLVRNGDISIPKLKVCDGKRCNNCLDDDCSKCLPMALALLILGEDPRKYGFNATDDEIIGLARNYLEINQLYWTLWELMYLQDYMRKQETIDERLRWFLETDLTAHIDYKDVTPHSDYRREKAKEMVDWQTYKDVAPSNLKIPHYRMRPLVGSPAVQVKKEQSLFQRLYQSIRSLF